MAFLVLGVSFPTPAAAGESETPLRVTVTVAPLAWLVSEVAGPEVEVEHLVDAGVAPETFQPTDLRITGVASSVLLFRIGVPAENGPWLHALEQSGGLDVVDLRQGLTLLAADHHHHHGTDDSAKPSDATDPHVWLSPRRLEVMATTVAGHLAAVDPPRAEHYDRRARAVRARLRALDRDLTERLAPVRGRTFFVFHPSWGYFADDYGLRQVAIEVEGKEPSERELTQLLRQAQAHGIRAVFVQPQVHSETPQALARALGARLETLDPLAPDLPANLLLAAERLLAAMLPGEEDPRSR